MSGADRLQDPNLKGITDVVQEHLNALDPTKVHIPIIVEALFSDLEPNEVQGIIQEVCSPIGFPRPEDFIKEALTKNLSNHFHERKDLNEVLDLYPEFSEHTKKVIIEFKKEHVNMPLDTIICLVFLVQSEKASKTDNTPILMSDILRLTNKAREFRAELEKAYDKLSQPEKVPAEERKKAIDLGVSYYLLKREGKSTESLEDQAQEIALGLKTPPAA